MQECVFSIFLRHQVRFLLYKIIKMYSYVKGNEKGGKTAKGIKKYVIKKK